MCPTDINDINAYYVLHCVCYIINSINSIGLYTYVFMYVLSTYEIKHYHVVYY